MDPCTHLLFSPESPARIDVATDLGIPVVAARGWTSLTPQVIASEAECTRQAVAQWFGDQRALRLHIARRFVARHTRWTEVRVHLYGPAGLLPETAELLSCTRVWLALQEAAARDDELAELVTTIRAEESLALTRRLERAAHDQHGVAVSALPPAVALLHSVADGLRLALAGGADHAGAVAVLDTAFDHAAKDLVDGRHP